MIDWREQIAGRIVVASVSGGKDSAALCLWLMEQGIEHRRVFANTAWEYEDDATMDTYAYLRGPLTAKLGPIDEVGYPGGMPALLRAKGMFPSRKARFCTEELKTKPLAAYMRAIGKPIVNAVGIRRNESDKRADALEWEPADDIYGADVLVWRPLILWTEQDVIDIHKRHGLAPNPLYLRGARRVGCWPCIFSRKSEIRQVAETTPERVDQIRQLEAEVAELAAARYAEEGETFESKGYSRPTFFQAQGALRNPKLGKDGRMTPIDEVVAWSKTKRGGKEFEPFVVDDGGCVRWGLCETRSAAAPDDAAPATTADVQATDLGELFPKEKTMILLNTGPSARGWHRLEAYLRCPQLFAWGYGQGGSNPERAVLFPPTFPLVRGSIGHAGLAHCYSIAKARQEGSDASRFYMPLDAMQLVADTFGDLGADALPVASRAVRAYAQHYGEEPWRVLAVEEPAETAFEGYRYTARLDLVVEDKAGKVWIVDHKFVSKIESKVVSRYTLSGQFLGLSWIGSRTYGNRFGGVKLNLVGCQVAGFQRMSPQPAPWMLERFPWVVRRAEEGIARLEAQLAAGEPVEAAPSEHTCVGSYGTCPAFELCRWGKTETIVDFGDGALEG